MRASLFVSVHFYVAVTLNIIIGGEAVQADSGPRGKKFVPVRAGYELRGKLPGTERAETVLGINSVKISHCEWTLNLIYYNRKGGGACDI